MNILVTGGSRGIGRAICLELAAPGRRILINYLRNEAAARETAAAVESRGAEALVVQGNVRSEDDLKLLASAFDRVDLLVHNAAVGALRAHDAMRTTHWDLTLESSLRPFWLLTKLAPLADGASVIGVSSLGSRRFTPGYAAMGASKAGMEALTRQLAVELSPRGIRVNTVCGGLIETETLDYFPDKEELVDFAVQRTPMGRLGQPEDLARVVAFLASEAAGWITGQVIVADGGFSVL
ncbi:MAG: SDR family oxidoreductase [Myxococcota bacterium]|nr:SDR family oxidoreductase [Myxococcota bacterium]